MRQNNIVLVPELFRDIQATHTNQVYVVLPSFSTDHGLRRECSNYKNGLQAYKQNKTILMGTVYCDTVCNNIYIGQT